MIGKYQQQLGADQFISGMSSSDYATDGMLGTTSSGLNPFVTPGLIRAIANPTDVSTNIAGNLIASCSDAAASFSNNRFAVDDARNYYSFNGTSFTKQKTATGGTYTASITDMVPFVGSFFTTVTNDITKWNGTSTLDESYWHTTQSQALLKSGAGQWHPLLIYQSFTFIGDGNLMHSLSTAEVAANSVLILPTNETICALGIEPQSGLMMISVSTAADNGDTIPSLKAVYLWDGILSKPLRKILVDDLVTAFYNVEGIVYVGAGQTIGEWNGNGVTFLRKLKNVALSNTDLLYKHHFANIRNILLVVDGAAILAYGAVTKDKRGFYYLAFPNSGSTNHFSIVAPVGNNKFIGGYATNTVLMWDLSSSGVGVASLYFNNIYFPRPIFVRRIRVITTGITTTSGAGGCTFFDEKNNQYNTQVVTFKVLAANSPQYVFDFDYTQAKVQGIQPRINFDTIAFGLVRVIIYYDIAE